MLDKLHITAVPKTSGKTGIHLFNPVENIFSYRQARAAVSTLCTTIHEIIPDITTIEKHHFEKR